MASRLPLLRRISKLLRPLPSSPVRSSRALLLLGSSRPSHSPWSFASSRRFCSDPLNLPHDSQGAAAIDYRSVLQEDEFHRIANSTIHDLQEKLEEYGDIVQIDGFDVDYGNEVLTLKLGALGTYVLNKQTPNRQIWLSSPVSGHKAGKSLNLHMSIVSLNKKLGYEYEGIMFPLFEEKEKCVTIISIASSIKLT
ncbi:PREDICTED: frataxin, mitochondrial isoform X1 [Theobroma cacao]|uniref:Frataxin, mitochondrial isoform X1 n=1 Tax=Theobroma cacao TaxID=3641 RepID=A0AB32W1V4_THECC|nr:PREDICTED: frataxin, mitochondrial isoform X1 [Theobroma cacao]